MRFNLLFVYILFVTAVLNKFPQAFALVFVNYRYSNIVWFLNEGPFQNIGVLFAVLIYIYFLFLFIQIYWFIVLSEIHVTI